MNKIKEEIDNQTFYEIWNEGKQQTQKNYLENEIKFIKNKF